MFAKVQAIAGQAQELKSGLSSKINEGWDPIPEPGKSKELMIGCCCGRDPECSYINTLKTELANSYYWSGVCLIDYFFFICQWHPLVGVFLCHPNHPWSKKERFLMILISLSITMVPSAFIGKAFAEDPVANKLFIILFVTVPDALSGVILYQLSIAETRRCCSACALCCIPIQYCLGWIQSCLMCVALFMGGVSTLICYSTLTVNGVTQWKVMLSPLAFGIGTSWITWFPLWFILPFELGFVSNWCAEKKRGFSTAADAIEQEHHTGQE